MKYNCLNPIANIGLDLFDASYEKTEDIKEADAVLVRSASMHEIELSDSVQAVARAGAGVNNIPCDEYAKKGIVVFNTPGANANGVKELAVAGMLLASRDILGGNKWVSDNASDENINKTMEKAKKQFAGNEILGKSLGIIGLGAIGGLLANAATALGMKVYGYDPYLSVDAAWKLSQNVIHVKNTDEIYEKCDFISVHVPCLDSTRGMINKEAFAKMKDGVVILNFARDALINDDDMAVAIEEGKVARYVTDFPNAKTANMKNVIATPHLGASTEESEDNCAIMAVRQLRDFLENGNITNSVNYPNCENGVCTTAARVTVCHKNEPNLLSAINDAFGTAGINVSSQVSKSKGEYAYTILDLDSPVSDELVAKFSGLNGIIKVRVVK